MSPGARILSSARLKSMIDINDEVIGSGQFLQDESEFQSNN
jgi:hypothetical protein